MLRTVCKSPVRVAATRLGSPRMPRAVVSKRLKALFSDST
jgi:hypothetical protein